MGRWVLSKKGIVFSLFFLLTVSLVFISIDNFSRDNSPQAIVEKSIAKINRAYSYCRITGGDWQDELEKQHKIILTLPQTNRIEFFKAVLIQREVFAAKSLNFAELVGSDSDALVDELNRFKKSTAFSKLSKDEQQRVLTWASHLDESGDSKKCQFAVKTSQGFANQNQPL